MRRTHLEEPAIIVTQLLLPLGGEAEYVKVAPAQRAARTIVLVRKLQQTLHDLCGLPRTLKAAGVSKNKLKDIAKAAINDGSLTFNPEELDENDAMNVLNEAYK